MWSDDGAPYQSSWGQHCSGCSCSGNLIELGTCSSSMWVSYLTIDDLTFINKNGCLMRVSYKRQELLALRGRLDSPPVLLGSVLLIVLVFCGVPLFVWSRLHTGASKNLDDFDFPIVNFPFICSNILTAPACGVYHSVDSIFQNLWNLSKLLWLVTTPN